MSELLRRALEFMTGDIWISGREMYAAYPIGSEGEQFVSVTIQRVLARR